MRTSHVYTIFCAIIVTCYCDSVEVSDGPEEATMMKCAVELGFGHDEIQRIKSSPIPDETNENERCLMKCIGRKMKYLTSEDIVDVHHLLELSGEMIEKEGYTKSEMRQMLVECTKKTGTEKCMTAFKNLRCLMNAFK
uniref:Odorant-binding protein 15 n=1 Tax=Oedaleus asiaticus TaxID=244712 RepID=A0A0E3XA41_9ORTH|nr:odorant-binding protein 15 [Oedaleus asiaticus]